MSNGVYYLACDMVIGLIGEDMPFTEEAQRRNVIANTKRAIDEVRAADVLNNRIAKIFV